MFRIAGHHGFILGPHHDIGDGHVEHVCAGRGRGRRRIAGAVLMVAAYFVGVAIVGAGVGAMAVHLAWTPFHVDPPWWAVVAAAILGALGALSITRYMVIVGTAFGGAWMLIVGALALMGNKAAAQATNEGSVWLVYPLDPAPGKWWVWALWFALAIAGAVTQVLTKGKGKKK
jgi:hypothetical protein